MPPYPPFFAPTHAIPGSHLTPFFPWNPSPVQETENGDNLAIQDSDDDDGVLLHDNESNTLFAEFNPEIKESGTWDPPEQMNAFLEWHFNCGLSPAERDAILGDFPKPNCPALEVPRLDDEVRSQLKSRGEDPQFGQEKKLFNIQGELLNVGGPLTCLWADMINPEVVADKEQIALLVQRALVLLGSASHSISLERRKIAWARINPKLKSLASEDYKDRKDKLFGLGFLEKASKKLE